MHNQDANPSWTLVLMYHLFKFSLSILLDALDLAQDRLICRLARHVLKLCEDQVRSSQSHTKTNDNLKLASKVGFEAVCCDTQTVRICLDQSSIQPLVTLFLISPRTFPAIVTTPTSIVPCVSIPVSMPLFRVDTTAC